MSFGPLPPEFAEVYDLRLSGLTIVEIADRLELHRNTITARWNKARLHIRGIREIVIPPTQMPKFAEFERGDLTPCGRCGLRGPHECLPARATGYLRQQDSA